MTTPLHLLSQVNANYDDLPGQVNRYPDEMTPSDVQTSFQGDDLDTWVALATVLEWLPPALDARLQQGAGLTHFEYGILYALANAPETTLRLSVLADYSNSSLSRLSRAATRLEKNKWIRRQTDPTDGRFTLAVLTSSGLDLYHLATPVHVQNVYRLVFNQLSPTENRKLREIAQRITQAIRGDHDRARYLPAPSTRR